MMRTIFLWCVLPAAGLIFASEQNGMGAPPEPAVPGGSNPPVATLSASKPASGSFALSQPSSLIPYPGARQLAMLMDSSNRPVPPPVAGRRIPQWLSFTNLAAPGLTQEAVPLPQADTLSQFNHDHGRLGRLQTADGRIRFFNPEVVLVKFKGARHVAAIRIAPGAELAAVRALAARPDVGFAELDSFETRESFPNDPLVGNQWHHQVLGSVQAWALSPGQSSIRIAIVDTPFQMNHPDLAPHVASGWDVDQNLAVTNSSGVDHSTLGAGLAAAVINNGLGIAGMGNCTILPININGAISEMYDAVIWAADHGVRVVNISWTGGDSDTLNAAGAYLAATDRGLLIMAGGNSDAAPYTTNQPDIYCISMTDEADNMQSLAGPQVDFAAPGWNIFSTMTGSSYGFASGTSYAAPVFAGVVAVLLSINPTLGPDDVIAILKATAHQPNGWPAGEWNSFYGWGRIDFAAAAAAAGATLPVITSLVLSNHQARITASYRSGAAYSLWQTTSLTRASWSPATGAVAVTNGDTISFVDPLPAGWSEFFRVEASAP